MFERKFSKRGIPYYFKINERGKKERISEDKYFSSQTITLSEQNFSDTFDRVDKNGRVIYQRYVRDNEGNLKRDRNNRLRRVSVSRERHLRETSYFRRVSVASKIANKREKVRYGEEIEGDKFSGLIREVKQKTKPFQLKRILSRLNNYDKLTDKQREELNMSGITVNPISGNVETIHDKRLSNYDTMLKVAAEQVRLRDKRKDLRSRQVLTKSMKDRMVEQSKRLAEFRYLIVQGMYDGDKNDFADMDLKEFFTDFSPLRR